MNYDKNQKTLTDSLALSAERVKELNQAMAGAFAGAMFQKTSANDLFAALAPTIQTDAEAFFVGYAFGRWIAKLDTDDCDCDNCKKDAREQSPFGGAGSRIFVVKIND